MSNNYFISVFGTFGNPNGFRQSYLPVDKNSSPNVESVARNIKTFDLNTNAIKLFPESKVYAIRKDYANGRNVVAYSIYTYAQEPTSTRAGSFIGSSILFIDQIPNENITIRRLNEFHNNLENKNVQNDTITVNHSDKLSVSNPKEFDKINFHLREIDNLNFAHTTNKQLVVYCEINPNKLQHLFKKAIDLLNVYDTIYFTQSKDVAEFVHQKNIFQLVQKEGFENEIKKLAEERERKKQEAIAEFVREKQKLEEDRKRLIAEYEKQIEQNERQHQENRRKIEESQKELKNIDQKYETYSKKIVESITCLKEGKKLDEVRRLHNENKRIFIDSINRQEKPNFLNSIPKPNTRTDLQTASKLVQTGHDYDNDEESYHRSRRKQGIDIFKVATLVLLLIWIGTLVYFLFFSKPEKETVTVNEPTQEQSDSSETTPSAIPLDPAPNDILPMDGRPVLDSPKNGISHGMTVDEVVAVIFAKNPNDVEKHYKDQKDAYASELIKQNPSCFQDENGNDTKKDGKGVYSRKTLDNIPCYRKISGNNAKPIVVPKTAVKKNKETKEDKETTPTEIQMEPPTNTPE